jgi:hypothetical protein
MQTPGNIVRHGEIIIETVRRAREQLVLRRRCTLKSNVIFHQSLVKNREVIGLKFVPGEILRIRQGSVIV